MYKQVNKCFTFINKKSRIIFLTPNYKSFGNCSEEIFYGILKAKRENKKLLLIYPKIPFNLLKINLINKELFCINHPRIVDNLLLQNFLSYLCGLYLIFLNVRDKTYKVVLRKKHMIISANRIPSIGKNDLWVPNNINFFDKDEAMKQNWAEQYLSYDPPELSKAKLFIAKKELHKLGLPKNAWFVCLHVPESKENKNVRQADIKNYIPSIKYITNQGGWVIRIGDNGNSKLPKLKNVIDYAHDSKNLPVINLYALSQCRMFIGVTSGPSLVASFFGRYVIGTNRTQLAHDYPFNLSIIKHIYDSRKKIFLSISDILDASSDTQFFEEKDSYFNLFENNSDEILQITKEGLNREPTTQIMKDFDEKIKITINRFIDEEHYPNHWNAVHEDQMYIYKYRAYSESPLCLSNSFISNKFLEDNWSNNKFKPSKDIT